MMDEDILNDIPLSISMSGENEDLGDHTNSWINNVEVSDGQMSDELGSHSDPL